MEKPVLVPVQVQAEPCLRSMLSPPIRPLDIFHACPGGFTACLERLGYEELLLFLEGAERWMARAAARCSTVPGGGQPVEAGGVK